MIYTISYPEWMSVTVAILTILITVLIGWQVFNAIEMRNTLNEMRNLSEDLNRRIAILQSQDDECRLLTEAYFLMRLSEHESSMPHAQYGRLGQSLLFFLKAKVKEDYHSLFTVCARMESVLKEIDKGNDTEKEFLADKYFPHEALSKAIFKELSDNGDRYSLIASKVKNLKIQRLSIIKTIKNADPQMFVEYADDIVSPFTYKTYEPSSPK